MPFRMFSQSWFPTSEGGAPRFGLYRDDTRDDEYLLALDAQGQFSLACGPIEPDVWGEHHHGRGLIYHEALVEEGLTWVAYETGPAANGHVPVWTHAGWYRPAEQRGIRAYVREGYDGPLRRRHHSLFSAEDES